MKTGMFLFNVFLKFWFASENVLEFTPMRHEKRSLAGLNEHLLSEVRVDSSSHLEREVELQKHATIVAGKEV